MDSGTSTKMDESSPHKAERTRRTWPDDGLPAHHEKQRHGSLHPAAVVAELLWR
jgi:hypothetical protein